MTDHYAQVDHAGEELKQARAATAKAMDRARIVVIAAVSLGGMTEVAAAKRAGVDRMTVRKWLGKL